MSLIAEKCSKTFLNQVLKHQLLNYQLSKRKRIYRNLGTLFKNNEQGRVKYSQKHQKAELQANSKLT